METKENLDSKAKSDEDFIKKAEEEYDYLRFTVVDFHGISRNKTYPRRQFRHVFEDGFYIFAGTLGAGINGDLEGILHVMDSKLGNLKTQALPETIHPLVLKSDKYRVGEVFCQMLTCDGQLLQQDPRGMAQVQVDKLSQLGFQLKSAWEVEYFVLDAKTLEPKYTNAGYVMSGQGMDLFGESCYEAENALEKSNITIEAFMSEMGNGQIEYIMTPVLGMASADNLILLKDVLKDVHRRYGDKAVFMTKPFPGEFCNGFHFNHSLLDAKMNNVFSDLSKPDKLSNMWRHWLAGIIKHCRALTALMCPTVNCYRRLHGLGVPSKADWGIDNRLATFRVKNFSPSGSFIEARMPSGSCNPYLVVAGTVAAGLDGLKNKLELPAALGDGEEEVSLPHTLQEALAALKEDEYMVEALGQGFVDWFAETKIPDFKILKDFEPKKDDKEMYAKERDLYMDIL